MASDPLFTVSYNDKAVRDRMARLLQKTGNLKPAMQDIGEFGLIVTERHFETESNPDGIPWQANSPYTIARKRAEGRIMKVLQNRGLMRAQTSYTATNISCTIGNNSPHARKHQLGIGVPKREFLGFGKADLEEVARILDDHITDNR